MGDAVVKYDGNTRSTTRNNDNNCYGKKNTTMDKTIKAYVNGSERVRDMLRKSWSAQTMTEYALILAAVAIVAYVTYQVMGQDIGSMVNTIESALATS